MAETKASDRLPLVELVASVRGFYNGRLVEPGASFMFDPNPREPGGKVKFPKWAAPKGEKAAKQPVDVKAFDTRPVEAQKAAKRKAGQMSGAAT